MSKAATLAWSLARVAELARGAVVIGCALALIAAGPVLPVMGS